MRVPICGWALATALLTLTACGGPSPDPTQPADAGAMSFPTLADFRVCDIDTDCPVGLGRCHAYPIYHRGTVDMCSARGASNVIRNITAPPGWAVPRVAVDATETPRLDPTRVRRGTMGTL